MAEILGDAELDAIERAMLAEARIAIDPQKIMALLITLRETRRALALAHRALDLALTDHFAGKEHIFGGVWDLERCRDAPCQATRAAREILAELGEGQADD
jgi:hypothetical protein